MLNIVYKICKLKTEDKTNNYDCPKSRGRHFWLMRFVLRFVLNFFFECTIKLKLESDPSGRAYGCSGFRWSQDSFWHRILNLFLNIFNKYFLFLIHIKLDMRLPCSVPIIKSVMFRHDHTLQVHVIAWIDWFDTRVVLVPLSWPGSPPPPSAAPARYPLCRVTYLPPTRSFSSCKKLVAFAYALLQFRSLVTIFTWSRNPRGIWISNKKLGLNFDILFSFSGQFGCWIRL